MPAQLLAAATTDDNLPAVTWEPCELYGALAAGRDSRGFSEAADVEDKASGVEEGVFVAASLLDSPRAAGYGVMAAGADEALFFRFVGGGPGGASSAFRRLPLIAAQLEGGRG